MGDYTPTTEGIKSSATEFNAKHEPEQFERWLAQVRAKAWDEGANSIFLANWHCCRARSTAIALSSSPDNPYRGRGL